MTTGELILNAAVLIFVLYRNLGHHIVNRQRFTIPIVIIAAVGVLFLRNIPTVQNDLGFEAIGLAAGLILGVIAGFLLRVTRTDTGQVMTQGGTWFALLWIFVIGARVAFSEGATHVFGHQVTDFSITNGISGSDAFTVMFVLMALAMITAMVATIAVRSAHLGSGPILHNAVSA
jgi:hypothetical protein